MMIGVGKNDKPREKDSDDA